MTLVSAPRLDQHVKQAKDNMASSSSGLSSPPRGRSESTAWAEQTDVLDLLGSLNIELDALPRCYLNAYPYPAFILLQRNASTAGDTGAPASVHDALARVDTSTPIWTNGKWRDRARHAKLSNCLSSDGAEQLRKWLRCGVDDANGNDGSAMAGRPRRPTTELEFQFGSQRTIMELTRSVMPLYHWNANARKRLASYNFTIVTSIPLDDVGYRPSGDSKKTPAGDDDDDSDSDESPSYMVLSSRRAALIRDMAQRTSSGRPMTDFAFAVLPTLEEYPEEAPFALLFRAEQTNQSRSRSRRRSSCNDEPELTNVRLNYLDGIGVPEGHHSAPASVTLEMPVSADAMIAGAFTGFKEPIALQTSRGYAPLSPLKTTLPLDDRGGTETTHMWPFVEAMRSRRPVIIEDCSLLTNGYPVRVGGKVPKSAVVIPAFNDSERLQGAILVLGLDLPYDREYTDFINILRLQMTFHYAAIKSYEAHQKHLDDAAALDRAKNVLFSNVSHELLTPLSLISGPLDDVLAELRSGRQHEALLLAKRNVNRLTRLVTMLMDVSSFEAGRLKGTFRRVNLGRLTGDIAGLFRKASDSAHLDLVVDCDLNDRATYVDREKWEKILFTLIGNALKYTLAGSVRVEVSYEGEEAIVRIVDSGIGFSTEDLEAFLEQEPRNAEGVGIALSFTKKLVQLHGGIIFIDGSNSGRTIVGIRLPLGSEHLPQDSVDDSDETPNDAVRASHDLVLTEMAQMHSGWVEQISDRHIAGAASSPPADISGKARGIDPSTLFFQREDVIMLVDDIVDSRKYMRSIFEPFCTVVEARDGQEALDMFTKDVIPDLVIADIVLPKVNGFELLRELRKGTKEQMMVPVILLTTTDDVRAFGAFGAEHYLPKPFNARDLIARAHMQVQLGKKRRRMEREFERRTSELRILTELSPVAIFRCSPDGYVTWANNAWYELAGYPVGQPVTNWGDYITDEHRDRVRKIWNDYTVAGGIVGESEWQWTNGRWVYTKVVRLDNIDGVTELGSIGCCLDVTERKLNEKIQRERVEEAEERRREAEEAKYQQELLIDFTSHCASLVKSNLLAWQEQLQQSEQAQEGFKPSKQLLVTLEEDLDALDSIYQCGLTQERISNDVLSLGKIQLDRMEMHNTSTDIRKLAQKLIGVFQYEARVKRLTLSLELSDNFERLGVTNVMADHVRVGQVLTNLLSNAIRFTSQSPIREVRMTMDIGRQAPADGTCRMPDEDDPLDSEPITADTDLYLFVTVSDTGPGLTESELSMLFQRFSQASSKTHTVFGGSGLGLFVCRMLTELMGGQICATSVAGEGAEFHFFIKTRPCLASQDEDSKQGTIRPMASRDRLLNGPYRPHILIAEDNLINRKILLRQLLHVGLTAETVGNGLEAVERLRKSRYPEPAEEAFVINGADDEPAETEYRPFQCVLMDLDMPVMDGYEASAVIREEEASGAIIPTVIIALTGNARQAKLTEGMKNFDDWVIKPYRLDDLLGKIEHTVRVKNTDAVRAAKKVADSTEVVASSSSSSSP